MANNNNSLEPNKSPCLEEVLKVSVGKPQISVRLPKEWVKECLVRQLLNNKTPSGAINRSLFLEALKLLLLCLVELKTQVE